jgi:hypothetical protein
MSWKMALKLVRHWFAAFLVGYSLQSFAQPQRGVPVSPCAAASVTVQTTCEAMLPAYCRGKYGLQFINLNRRNWVTSIPDGGSVEEAISPPPGGRVTAGDDGHYHKVTQSALSPGYVLTLPASKTGGYRPGRCLRIELTPSGRHPIVIFPKFPLRSRLISVSIGVSTHSHVPMAHGGYATT